LGRLRRFKERLGPPASTVGENNPFDPVMCALADDLNTPDALGRLFTVVKEFSAALEAGRITGTAEGEAAAGFQRVMEALGFTLPAEAVAAIPDDIQKLAAERWQARTNKDWAASDSLRKQLEGLGWNMRDGRDGYTLAVMTTGEDA